MNNFIMTRKAIQTINAGLTLAIRSIGIQIREHLLGYAWTLIIPMLYAFCYIFIKRELVGDATSDLADSGWDIVRAFAGITLFQFWMQVVQDMSEMVRRQRGMLRGLDIGPTPFALAIVFEGFVALAVRMVLIILAIPVLGLEFPAMIYSWLWFFASLLVLLLTATAIGLVLAPWAALYGDVRKALRSLNLPLILVSPIFYPAVERGTSKLYYVNIVNPLAPPLAVIADVLHGKTGSIYSIPLLAWGGLSLVLVIWGLLQLRRQVPVLLERLGS